MGKDLPPGRKGGRGGEEGHLSLPFGQGEEAPRRKGAREEQLGGRVLHLSADDTAEGAGTVVRIQPRPGKELQSLVGDPEAHPKGEEALGEGREQMAGDGGELDRAKLAKLDADSRIEIATEGKS